MKKLKISYENMDLGDEDVELDSELVSDVDSTTSGVTNADENVKFDDVDEMELSSAMESFIETETKEFETDNRAIDTSNALLNLGDTILSDKGNISTESLSLMGQFAVAGTDLHSDALISKASFENKRVAIESIGDKIGSVITNIVTGIIKIIETIVPVLRSFYTFFSFQKKTAADFINKIKAMSGTDKITVQLKGSRYFIHGTGVVVKNGSEYSSLNKETTDFLSASNSAAIAFTKSRFLSKTKATLSAIALGAYKDSLFFDMYSHLQNDLLQPLSKLPGMTLADGNDEFKQYKSKVLLGGLELNVKLADLPVPKDKTDLSSAMKKSVGIVPLNTVALDNALGLTRSSNLSLEFTKEELLEIANQSLKLAIECEKHIDFNIKWNLLFSGQIGGIMEKFGNIPYTVLSQCLATVRIVRLGAYLTQTMLGSCFSACKGLIANNFKIINQALISKSAAA